MPSDTTGNDAASKPDRDFEQLKLLFEYTKFHIGLYATLVTLLIAWLGLGTEDVPDWQKACLYLTTIFFVLAGMCGGVIASSLPNITEMSEFDLPEKKIGPNVPWCRSSELRGDGSGSKIEWKCLRFCGPTWATWEHRFFWIGILIALIGLLFGLFLSGVPDCPARPSGQILLECKPK